VPDLVRGAASGSRQARPQGVAAPLHPSPVGRSDTMERARLHLRLANGGASAYFARVCAGCSRVRPKRRPMAKNGPQPQPGILDISPYVPGESSAPGGIKPIKLSSNETPLGPSPRAVAAYKAEAEHLDRYPDGGATALRAAIGRLYGLDPARIVCGSGSDELINIIAHAYIGPGDEAVYSEHGFLMYKIATLASGGKPVPVPERRYTADVDAILARVGPKTRVVFLANPNNPTGTYLAHGEVRRLHQGLPAGTLLVLDAAYSEYVRRNDYEAGLELVATTENTVMTRTFSKIYGLAALRLGWAYCPAGVAD